MESDVLLLIATTKQNNGRNICQSPGENSSEAKRSEDKYDHTITWIAGQILDYIGQTPVAVTFSK
jgi:hypothetical protein